MVERGRIDITPAAQSTAAHPTSTTATSTTTTSTTTTTTFAQFYAAEFDGAVRLARLLTGSWDTARDIAQDAFCGLHRHWHRVEVPGAYLRRSIVNGANSAHRRRRRDAQRPLPVAESIELGADELSDALAALPPRQRAAIVLRHRLDLPDAEIAEALGVRVGTVASLVHRGLAQLRAAIDEPSAPSPPHPTEGSHP